MGRSSNTEVRKKQIVQGFARAIAKHGYTGASIGVIAKECDLTPGLLHYHFKSKEEILRSLIKEMSEYLASRMGVSSAGVRKESAEGAIEHLIGAYLDLDDGSNPIYLRCWTVIFAEAATNGAVKKLVHAALEQQRAEIERVVLGLPSAQSKRQIAEWTALVLAAIQGYMLIGTLIPELIPSGSASRTLKSLLRGVSK